MNEDFPSSNDFRSQTNELKTRLQFAREILSQFELNHRRTFADNQRFFSQFKVHHILFESINLSRFFFFQECEDDFNALQTTTSQQEQLTHSLADELTTVRASSFLFFSPLHLHLILLSSQLTASITRARIELENQIAFSLELDSFYNWLKKLTKKGKQFDQQVS